MPGTARIGILLLTVVGLLCIGAGCSDNPEPHEASKKSPTQIMLYCGAGIMPAAKALIDDFEKSHDIKIDATYAGSGRLLGQISTLQTGDLFMPGATLYVDKAIEKGLAYEESKKTVAYFIPVIFVAKGNPKDIQSLVDLKRKGLRLGLGDERSCAVGKKTLKIFEKNKIPYADVEENVVYKSGTVNELALAVQLGNVDAVICWDTNARHFSEYGDIVAIPREENVISAIPIVVLKCSKVPDAARKFAEFVTSENGRKILTANKYTVSLDK